MKLFILFGHLMAMCAAVGMLLSSHIRTFGRLGAGKRLRLRAPSALVTRTVTGSLVLLWVTGAALVWLGMEENPAYLDNPKLHAKVLLVTLLSLNGVVLHRFTFPRLGHGKAHANGLGVSVPLALSSSLWLVCAFLGVARSLNFIVPLEQLLFGAALVFAAALFLVSHILYIPTKTRTTHRFTPTLDESPSRAT